jgi:hypothetical protein
MAKKKFDPKAKAKRQKIMVAVGGVLLLGLLAFQVPRTMKMLHPQDQTASSSSAATSSTATTPGATPLAPPALDGSATAASGSSATSNATSADGVTDPSNPLPPDAGQLVSFSMFKSKDPFHQQINTACLSDTSGETSSCPSSGSGAGSAKSASTTKSKSGGSAAPEASIVKVSTTRSVPAKVTKATISVNGTASTALVGGSFPSSSPVFKLVSLTRSAAKIGILGGSYESGASTVTLAKGKTVTLMNTADGTRYVLQLVSVA